MTQNEFTANFLNKESNIQFYFKDYISHNTIDECLEVVRLNSSSAEDRFSKDRGTLSILDNRFIAFYDRTNDYLCWEYIMYITDDNRYQMMEITHEGANVYQELYYEQNED